jgi:hypothetical protein
MGDLLSCDVASLNCRNQRNTENVSASISHISVPTPVIGPPEAQNRKMHTIPQFVDSDAPLLQGIVPLAIASSFFLDFRLPIGLPAIISGDAFCGTHEEPRWLHRFICPWINKSGTCSGKKRKSLIGRSV